MHTGTHLTHIMHQARGRCRVSYEVGNELYKTVATKVSLYKDDNAHF